MVRIFNAIFKRSCSSEDARRKFYCAKCGKEVDSSGVYLRLTGDFLHRECLAKYMLDMNILEDIKRHYKKNKDSLK